MPDDGGGGEGGGGGGGRLLIFQEWAAGGSVAGVVKAFGPLPDATTARYLRDCLRGLAHLHAHRVIHRDIKGDNVLIDASGVAKVADFGTSKEQDAEGTRLDMNQTVCGTPYFWAPELMRNAGYGRKVDVWSVGGLGLQMATGDPPWYGAVPEQNSRG